MEQKLIAIDKKNRLFYLSIGDRDEDWGIIVTTVGSQSIPPRTHYPPFQHPNNYLFVPNIGRVINEYQLVYITSGSGWFSSKHIKKYSHSE